MRPSRLVSILALTFPLPACNEADETTSGGAGGSGAATDSASANQYVFDTASYTVKPGEERRYLCFSARLPADKGLDVTKVEPIYGKAIHHIAVYQTFGGEPDGAFDCPELAKDTWVPVYLAGVSSSPLEMPAGAALQLKAGTQILVQLHLLNATSDTVTDKARIVFHTTDAPDPIPAGVFAIDDRDITLPAHGQGIEISQSCPNIGRDMDVFAVFGHMHQLGTKIETSRGPTPGQEVLFTEPWNFNDQPTSGVKFHVAKTDTLNVRCWYDNPGDKDVTYGESTTTEMCAFILYYTPYKSIDACLKFPK